MSHRQLYFSTFEAHQWPAVQSRITVYAESEYRIDNRIYECYVIGESHCIYCPSLQRGEIFSCVDFDLPGAKVYALDQVEKITLADNANSPATATHDKITFYVWDEALYARARKHPAIASYLFQPGAWTSIVAIEHGYSTWHSYPEYNLIVHTSSPSGFK